MKVALWIIVAVIIVAGGGYALVKHNDNKNKASSSASTSSYGTSSTSGNSSSSSSTQNGAVNNAVLVTKSSTSVGSYLATPGGAALYTYGGDTSGVSNCTGSCVSAWPAYEDTGATTSLPANVGVIKRSDDGNSQFTYKGSPLYTFASESKGQVTGDGISNFHVARP